MYRCLQIISGLKFQTWHFLDRAARDIVEELNELKKFNLNETILTLMLELGCVFPHSGL